ncbi:MAG: sulfur carrier protein ThiS [Desulfarculaceae bacterium]|nr:sulfur carrier protein ThiS [Desulfarculaceae bacterium]MCF8072043.1 sulfur carrier protein ThiS [Desulfarculaceae bacterium]MCF8101560.1 sulfur carrier protein ThiS [Desulfarculaceae bacterium]MCF8115110.1 sulfur carrier protein ThiS [Desulfarculaceae bacterium]
MAQDMEITVNGMMETVPRDSTLDSLIVLFEEEHPELIAELNGRFVHRQDYAATKVGPGDRVEFINAAFGG